MCCLIFIAPCVLHSDLSHTHPAVSIMMEVSPSPAHRMVGAGRVLSSQHLGLPGGWVHHGQTGESRGQASATDLCSWGLLGNPGNVGCRI